jgi:hypothetical protein
VALSSNIQIKVAQRSYTRAPFIGRKGREL